MPFIRIDHPPGKPAGCRLAANPGLRREHILINLVELKKEIWSFGNGIAPYAPP